MFVALACAGGAVALGVAATRVLFEAIRTDRNCDRQEERSRTNSPTISQDS